MAKVELDRLTVQFGDVAAVDGISLVLEQGEFIVLLGPSGCGKTTALRSIAGLQQASSGEIRFDGKPVTDSRLQNETSRWCSNSSRSIRI